MNNKYIYDNFILNSGTFLYLFSFAQNNDKILIEN